MFFPREVALHVPSFTTSLPVELAFAKMLLYQDADWDPHPTDPLENLSIGSRRRVVR